MSTDKAPLSANVGRNVKTLRLARGWSVRQLAEECEKQGATSLTHPSLTNLERSPTSASPRAHREVTVDQLYTLAAVLDVTADRLVHGPSCDTCNDEPPDGFACLACGMEGKKP